ncbi:hypothetical protein PV326_011460, partial [Microctonus aethiopoides]
MWQLLRLAESVGGAVVTPSWRPPLHSDEFSLSDIFVSVESTPSSRNIKEGEELINSNFIISCGATELSKKGIKIYGLCLKTSSLTSDPHVITGELLFIGNSVKIKSMNYSCKAGNSHTCKHVVAILLYCNRNDVQKFEILSGTDVKCIWKQLKTPSTEQFKASPIDTFCCIEKVEPLVISSENYVLVRQRLANCDPNSALSKHS